MPLRDGLNEQVNNRKVMPGPLHRESLATSAKSAPTTDMAAKTIQKSPLRSKTDGGKHSAKSHVKATIQLERRPENRPIRLLVALIFAESCTPESGGREDNDEKFAIGATVLNRTHFAVRLPKKGEGGRCSNTNFGDGSVKSAISFHKQFKAYDQEFWKKIADAQDLKSQAALNEALESDNERRHYNLSVQVALRLAGFKTPIPVAQLGSKIPVSFDQDASPTYTQHSNRLERLGPLGPRHYFYGFKKDNECVETHHKNNEETD